MSVSDHSQGRAVALLARPGAARERLKEAVLAAGGHLVLEEDPNQMQPSALQSAAATLVLVALEPAVEDALERLEPALDSPQLELMFEEAELAARREGWDAQRWTRHLAAKLQGHGNVLPPGQEEEALAMPEPGKPESPEQRHAGAPLQFHVDEAEQHIEDVPVDGLYQAPVADAQPEVLSFEELMARAPRTPEQPGVVDSPAPPVAPPPMPAAAPGSFHEWSLLDDDAYVAAAPAAAPAAEAAAAPLVAGGLADSLSLVELESEAEAAAPAAVLLLAGIGGPDAVRRLLGALPEEFPLPVMVQMRLDGGRHANLVRQMQRVSMLPVELAASGQALAAGNVYILPDGIGLAPQGSGLCFVEAEASLLQALPPQGSAVVMLSGADPALVQATLEFAERGGWVAGQNGEGCYDPEAASHLCAAGHPGGSPEHLATELVQRSFA